MATHSSILAVPWTEVALSTPDSLQSLGSQMDTTEVTEQQSQKYCDLFCYIN